MQEYDIRAILDIRVIGEANSPEEALARAIQNKSYEIVGSRLNDTEPIKYISTAEYAKRVGHRSGIYISKLCAKGAIPGAIRIGNSYAIPENTPYIDRRVTEGKYTGQYEKYGRKQYEARQARKAAGLPEPPKRPPNDNPIARARRERGWMQSQLAEAVGTSTRQISNWECGFRRPNAKNLQRLADVLGVDADTLIEKNES